MNKIKLRFAAIVTMAAVIGTSVFWISRAAAQPAAPGQKTFATPDQAVEALSAAVKIHDRAALNGIFGPDVKDLLTGDEKQDKANSKEFAKVMAQGVKPVSDGDKFILEIGDNQWPFPIPLVKADSGWRFDTAAGKEEIINRHIGKDELHAIGVCEAFVREQGGSSGTERHSNKTLSYARSLIGSLNKSEAAMPQPFHGYIFRTLPSQAADARAKVAGVPGRFALEAYPEHWGQSGIMTFIVNQNGLIFQRDLGEKTAETAGAMTQYDPNDGWTPEKDHGVVEN